MTLAYAWDRYAFTLDKEFLRTRAWPILHDASLFFLTTGGRRIGTS